MGNRWTLNEEHINVDKYLNIIKIHFQYYYWMMCLAN